MRPDAHTQPSTRRRPSASARPGSCVGLGLLLAVLLLALAPRPARAICFDLIACEEARSGQSGAAALIPVVAGTEVMHVEHMLHMDLKRLLALGSGLAFGRFFAEAVFESGHEIGFFFMIVGALFGEMLYQKEVWPFTPSEPMPGAPGAHPGDHGPGGQGDDTHGPNPPTHTEVRRGTGYPLLYVPVPQDKPFPTR